MTCPKCENEMGDPVDTTFSNINTKRAITRLHTGDIYKCKKCQLFWIDDFLSKTVYIYNY